MKATIEKVYPIEFKEKIKEIIKQEKERLNNLGRTQVLQEILHIIKENVEGVTDADIDDYNRYGEYSVVIYVDIDAVKREEISLKKIYSRIMSVFYNFDKELNWSIWTSLAESPRKIYIDAYDGYKYNP